MRRFRLAWLTLLVAVLAMAADTPLPPPPQRWVTDGAGVLSESVVRTLDARLERYESQTGHQLLVWTGKSTGGEPLEEWSARTFEAWRVGRKGIDDGLVVFLLAEDRRIRIEVGYGLEPVVTDAQASRLLRDVALPALRAGDADRAVTGTVEGLISLIGGEEGAQPARARAPPMETGQKLLLGILGLIVLVIFITHPSFALWLLVNILSGSRGGGRSGRGGGGSWGGGGGGFSGGGGRSGGGGASGSW